jgi:hypothetical protein
LEGVSLAYHWNRSRVFPVKLSIQEMSSIGSGAFDEAQLSSLAFANGTAGLNISRLSRFKMDFGCPREMARIAIASDCTVIEHLVAMGTNTLQKPTA